MKKILLVEDEEHLQDAIRLNLEMDNYAVTTTDNGLKALEIAIKTKFDLIVLDVMLPQLNGFDICKQLRSQNITTPILFLTARNTSKDRIEGLKIGGDDYLGKPFDLEELLLRVKKLIDRNTVAPTADAYQFGTNKINFSSFECVGVEGIAKQFSQKEIALLKLLISQKGKVVSREEILEQVWGYNSFPTTRTIDNFIVNFRKFFEKNSKQPVYFQSIRGVGYKFND